MCAVLPRRNGLMLDGWVANWDSGVRTAPSQVSFKVIGRVSSVSALFFFSSRRRHTRLQGDWSSDVCSSDLIPMTPHEVGKALRDGNPPIVLSTGEHGEALSLNSFMLQPGEEKIIAAELVKRSEERRVGKEGRSRWSPYH